MRKKPNYEIKKSTEKLSCNMRIKEKSKLR